MLFWLNKLSRIYETPLPRPLACRACNHHYHHTVEARRVGVGVIIIIHYLHFLERTTKPAAISPAADRLHLKNLCFLTISAVSSGFVFLYLSNVACCFIPANCITWLSGTPAFSKFVIKARRNV